MTQDAVKPGGEIVLFEAPDGQICLDVQLVRDTVWLSQAQMAELFGRERSVITKHINNVFREGELDRDSVCANFAHTADDGKTYTVQYLDLDVIISVGYRVKSQRGTQFRIWATRTLRDHIVQGYTLHERRLREKCLAEMEQAVRLLAQTLSAHGLVEGRGQAVLDVVAQYARSWQWLLQYDEERLPDAPLNPTLPVAGLSLTDSRQAIAGLTQVLMAKGEATELFGRERSDALDAILGSIEQTFGGESLYPSVEARAAHLLYFIIKDHPFTDGNKRIGGLLFLLYLDRNGLLVNADGTPRFTDNALVALALLTAQSAPVQKELLIRLILNFLGDGGV